MMTRGCQPSGYVFLLGRSVIGRSPLNGGAAKLGLAAAGRFIFGSARSTRRGLPRRGAFADFETLSFFASHLSFFCFASVGSIYSLRNQGTSYHCSRTWCLIVVRGVGGENAGSHAIICFQSSAARSASARTPMGSGRSRFWTHAPCDATVSCLASTRCMGTRAGRVDVWCAMSRRRVPVE